MIRAFAYIFDCPKLATTLGVDLADNIFADALCPLWVADRPALAQ